MEGVEKTSEMLEGKNSMLVPTEALFFAGLIVNWSLGEEDQLQAPYFRDTPNKQPFNKLFAALYDLVLSRLSGLYRGRLQAESLLL